MDSLKDLVLEYETLLRQYGFNNIVNAALAIHADRASAEGLRAALRDLLNYESVHPLTGGNKTRLEAVRAALHSSESDNRIDVERLARALWGINFERPEIFRLATDIARRYEAEGPHDAAGKIAAEYARLYTPRTETNDSTCHCSCDADHNESDHRP